VTVFFAATRWLHEASLMLLFGTAMLRAILRARLPTLSLPPGHWRVWAALIALMTAIIWLGLTTGQMAGNAQAMIDVHVLGLTITQTLFGQMFQARLLLLLFLCGALAFRAPEIAIALLSGGALVLISVTSHAAAASPANFTAIGVTSDGLHLLTAGFWIGGLVLLAALFARRTEKSLLAAATGVFAEWGMIAVAILVMTGMLNATTILLGGEGHDTGAYLAVLGIKLACVLAMVSLAVINHFRLLPSLKEDGLAADCSEAGLFRNIRFELGLGLIVIALAALLGLLPPTM
jgi:putative copper resistance protein D